MIINIDLSKQSIDDAIKQLREYEIELQKKLKRVCDRLAEIGAEEMRRVYGDADYAGTNDVQVRVEDDVNGYVIIAYGVTVGFIEFGTGIAYPESPIAAQNKIPSHGTYGKKKGATGKSWVYVGDTGTTGWRVTDKDTGEEIPGIAMTRGNPPANAFPAAVSAIMDKADDVIKEVFGG